jgi:hypothetical protein
MAKAMQTTLNLETEDLAILEAIQRERGLFSRAQALHYALRKYAELVQLTVPKKPASRR